MQNRAWGLGKQEPSKVVIGIEVDLQRSRDLEASSTGRSIKVSRRNAGYLWDRTFRPSISVAFLAGWDGKKNELAPGNILRSYSLGHSPLR